MSHICSKSCKCDNNVKSNKLVQKVVMALHEHQVCKLNTTLRSKAQLFKKYATNCWMKRYRGGRRYRDLTKFMPNHKKGRAKRLSFCLPLRFLKKVMSITIGPGSCIRDYIPVIGLLYNVYCASKFRICMEIW